jgi:hypothetical protein
MSELEKAFSEIGNTSESTMSDTMVQESTLIVDPAQIKPENENAG